MVERSGAVLVDVPEVESDRGFLFFFCREVWEKNLIPMVLED